MCKGDQRRYTRQTCCTQHIGIFSKISLDSLSCKQDMLLSVWSVTLCHTKKCMGIAQYVYQYVLCATCSCSYPVHELCHSFCLFRCSHQVYTKSFYAHSLNTNSVVRQIQCWSQILPQEVGFGYYVFSSKSVL